MEWSKECIAQQMVVNATRVIVSRVKQSVTFRLPMKMAPNMILVFAYNYAKWLSINIQILLWGSKVLHQRT